MPGILFELINLGFTFLKIRKNAIFLMRKGPQAHTNIFRETTLLMTLIFFKTSDKTVTADDSVRLQQGSLGKEDQSMA